MIKPKFLTAQWKNLLMLNYEVDPAILAPHLPAATVLDLWEGKALVSMVGFMFIDTRVGGIRWPWHINFEEVNLRFYIKHFDGKDWKRGAVFISEIVPKSLIVLIANNLYKEHYRALPMRHIVERGDTFTKYSYEWRLKGKWNKLSGDVSNQFKDIKQSSAEEFIFEHYWGYNSLNATSTMEYQVEHISWQIAQVTDPIFDADIKELYDEKFVPFLQRKPYSAFFANGSAISVRLGEKIFFDPALPISPAL
ncbi:MAG: DUF2071 domain-containing protein [Mucilaginibacter sp.]